jgi:alkylation response protein AidB-like acyl-CoA dehydrogenase
MDFSIPEPHRQFAATFERFCQERIAPRAASVDKAGHLPPETWADLAEIGFFGLYHEPEWGGAPGDWLMRALAEEALAKACASTFLSAGASVGLCGGPIARFGSRAQKARWLPGLVRGELVGCFGLTEPDAGTDAAAIRCRARKVDGGWSLTGEKALITNAPNAHVGVILAVTDPDAGYAGVTAFVVDLAGQGVTRSAPYNKLGLRGSPTGGLTFTDVALTDDDVLGAVGGGFLQAMQTLEQGRISMAHFGIGIADAALEASLRYAVERKAFGKPIATKQAIHFPLADMRVEIDAARLMARKVAWMKDAGRDCQELASVAKVYATEMAVRVCDHAVQIFGGWGYTDEFPVERLLRDARLGPIGEGTSEIQRELIARHMLDG